MWTRNRIHCTLHQLILPRLEITSVGDCDTIALEHLVDAAGGALVSSDVGVVELELEICFLFLLLLVFVSLDVIWGWYYIFLDFFDIIMQFIRRFPKFTILLTLKS